MAPTKGQKKENEITVKVGEKYQLTEGQEMWKDDKSGVFLHSDGQYILSRPKDTDYRTQLDWFNSKRFKDPDKEFIRNISDKDWFEITKGMDVSRIKIAIKNGILEPKKKRKKIAKKEIEPTFKRDKFGNIIYNGPHKNIYRFLQMKEKKIIEELKEIINPQILETLYDMEQKGWNPVSAPRGKVMDAIKKQLEDNAIGISKIKEEASKVETGKDLKDQLEEIENK